MSQTYFLKLNNLLNILTLGAIWAVFMSFDYEKSFEMNVSETIYCYHILIFSLTYVCR